MKALVSDSKVGRTAHNFLFISVGRYILEQFNCSPVKSVLLPFYYSKNLFLISLLFTKLFHLQNSFLEIIYFPTITSSCPDERIAKFRIKIK